MRILSTYEFPHEVSNVAIPVSQRRNELVLCLSIPLLLCGVATALQYGGIDHWLAAKFYDSSSHTWPLREHWLAQTALHRGAQYSAKALGLALLVSIFIQALSKRTKGVPKGLSCLFLAMLAGPLVIGILKSITHLPTPWDTIAFGGSVPHIRLFDSVPVGVPVGHGFPAAHASVGFAFCALYFTAILSLPRRRFQGLALGLCLGLLFGFAQQTRGAHFLSHDLFSLAICWTAAGCVYFCFYGKQMARFFAV